MAQRPDIFTLNESHHLAKGLVFAGLGAHAGSTRYHDSCTFANTGTMTNMEPATDWTPDPKLNRLVINVDGTNEYVESSANAVLKPSGSQSWSGWFKGAASGGSGAGFGTLGGSSTRGYMLGQNGTPNTTATVLIATSSSAAYAASSATTGAFTEWTHLAGVFIPSVGIYLYKNGILDASNTTSPPSSQYTANGITLKIGNRGDVGAGTYWSGAIADPMMWNRAIAVSEIQQLADPSNVMLSGLIQPPRRKWWPVVSGGTPATFKAAWAARRRQTIGGGTI